MKPICFAPGPTELHPIVEVALRDAVEQRILSRSHRTEWFSKHYGDVKTRLGRVLGLPEGMRVFFVSSATEAMERVVQNTVQHESFHYVNGAFSERLWLTSKELGYTANRVYQPDGEGFRVEETTVPANAELMCVTQNETSTGCMVPFDSLAALKQKYPNKLLAVDVVSCCPSELLDYSLVDCAFFSVQKCFGLPAGLGVLMVSEQAMEVSRSLAEKGLIGGTYHSFAELGKWEAQLQTPETPNVLAIYLLSRVLEEFEKEGIDRIRWDMMRKLDVIHWWVGNSPRLSFFVKDEEFQSNTVAALELDGDAFWLRAELAKRGFEVGAGYKEHKKTQCRIANFPMHTYEQMHAMMEVMHDLAAAAPPVPQS